MSENEFCTHDCSSCELECDSRVAEQEYYEDAPEGCTHDCSTCGAACSHNQPESLREPLNQDSSIKRVIGIMSGKGGVGKSLVTALTAVQLQRRGLKVGIMDADITGPSIPRMFGIKEMAMSSELGGIEPVVSKMGIKIMSVNVLLEDIESPVIWRGPVISGLVKQFWTDVVWGDLDVMLIDMPPGTGDVPLTAFQSIPIDGIITVTSPQGLVSLIVAKAVNMANMMEIPLLGIVENFSYFKCPDCGKEYKIFGESHLDECAATKGIPVIEKLPIDPELAKLCDNGMIELFENDTYAQKAADAAEGI